MEWTRFDEFLYQLGQFIAVIFYGSLYYLICSYAILLGAIVFVVSYIRVSIQVRCPIKVTYLYSRNNAVSEASRFANYLFDEKVFNVTA